MVGEYPHRQAERPRVSHPRRRTDVVQRTRHRRSRARPVHEDLHPDGDDQDAFDELEASGLWSRVEDGYLLAGWSDDLHQSTAEEIHRYRDAAKRRQQAYRDRQRGTNSEPQRATAQEPRAMRDVTHNATSDVTAHVGSRSLSDTTTRSAYVTRHVTRHADSPFCANHPTGTSDPCGACARARTAYEARQNTIAGLGWDCAVDGHKLVVDGTCAVCAYRPRPTAV